MSAKDNKVLACVDRSRFATTVTDYAAWAARRMAAPLELLHVIDRHPEIGSGADHSGAIGVDAQQQLLSRLAEQDAARSRALREEGRLFLNRLRARAEEAGVEAVDMRQRHGELAQTLVEHEPGVRLFVLGRRGDGAESDARPLGRNLEWVVRSLSRPILTCTEGFREPGRILFAFDGSAVGRRGVEMVAASPLFRGLPIHLLMSGKAGQDAPKQLEWARSTLETAGFEASARLLPGDAAAAITTTISAEGIDLLIMGAYAHSPLRALLLGSRTTALLRAVALPTLLLR